MTRENKIGLAVCGLFVGLVGTVGAIKLNEPPASDAPPTNGSAVALANNPPTPNADKETSAPTPAPTDHNAEPPPLPPPPVPEPPTAPAKVEPPPAPEPAKVEPPSGDLPPPAPPAPAVAMVDPPPHSSSPGPTMSDPPPLPPPPSPPGDLPAPPAPPGPPADPDPPAEKPEHKKADEKPGDVHPQDEHHKKKPGADESENVHTPPGPGMTEPPPAPPVPPPPAGPPMLEPPPVPPAPSKIEPPPPSVVPPPRPSPVKVQPSAPELAVKPDKTVVIPAATGQASPGTYAPGSPGVVANTPGAAPSKMPSPTGSTPLVDSWDERTYVCQTGDDFASIARSIYKSDDYAVALQLYNRSHPRASEALRRDGTIGPGDRIYLPPPEVLQKRHGDAITKAKPKPVAAGAEGGEFGTMQAGFQTPADAPPAHPAPTYKVQAPDGERLIEIAGRLLHDANRWTELAQLNPAVNAEAAVPQGTVLRLPTH